MKENKMLVMREKTKRQRVKRDEERSIEKEAKSGRVRRRGNE